MISPHKDESSKIGQFRAKVNEWIINNKDRGCSQFNIEVNKLNEIYRMLVERRFASIKEKYDVDYLGFLNLCCLHPNAKNAWIHSSCLLPFVIKIEDFMQTCADALHRIQHIESPANNFSWNKKMGYISTNISVNNGKFSSSLDDKTTVICQGVTDANGNLFTGRLRFFGDRIHSTLEPRRLSEFPKLQTKHHRMISSSMISAELQDDRGSQLYTKNPIRVIEKVPDMINNQTARTFKKFVFDPIDGVWVEKPGLTFNEGNRTFEYQFDTIDSLGPVYVNNLMKRLANLPLPEEKINLVKKLSFKQKVYKSVDQTFGYETYFPKCLRQNYIYQFQHQPTTFMHLYQEKMAYIQIEGKRFYFASKQYQQRIVSTELEVNQMDLNLWEKSIIEHNEDSRVKAEGTGFLSIDLNKYTFTRKGNAQKISIISESFKQLSLQGKEVNLQEKQQGFLDKIQPKKIIKGESSIFKSISDVGKAYHADEAQAQKKLIQQMTLQTVYIAERKYHIYLVNFLLRSIDHTKKKAKSASAMFKKQINNQAKIIEEQEKKRLLRELEEMKRYGQEIKVDKKVYESNLEDIQNEHYRIYKHTYIKQFQLEVSKIINGHNSDTVGRIQEMSRLQKDIKQCLDYLKKMKGLKGGGGVSFETLLQSLGAISHEYIRTMKTNTTLNTKKVKQSISLNPSRSVMDDNFPIITSFDQMKKLLQSRSGSLSTFLNRQSFKTADDDFLQKKLPTQSLRFLKLPQNDIEDINNSAVQLIKSSIREIINNRVNNQQIEKKINAAYENSGLARIYRRWDLKPQELSNYKEMIMRSVRSRMAASDFGKICEKFFVERLQKEYVIEVNESKLENMDCLKKKIMEIKVKFMGQQDYKVKWSDRIESYYPQFNSLESRFGSFIRVYTNVDGMTFYNVKWEPFTAAPCFTQYNYGFKVNLVQSAKSVKGQYFDSFIINDKGKVITAIAQDLKRPISLLEKSVKQSSSELLLLEGKTKEVKIQALKKQMLKDLVEDRKQKQMYQRTTIRNKEPISIPNVGQLTANEKELVQRIFKEQMLPMLENGDIKTNCQKEITKILKGMKEDELTFNKIQVDQKLHVDTIKDLTRRISSLESWIKDAQHLENQYKELEEKYEQIQSEKLYAKYIQPYPYSLQLHYQVITKNAQMQAFLTKLKDYNKKTTDKLKKAHEIDKDLFELDFNKIKISFSSESIQEIYGKISVKVNRLMDIVVEGKPGRQNVIQDIEESLSQLNELQLNSMEDEKASFNATTEYFKTRIRYVMSENELSHSEIKICQTKLQTFKEKVYQLKALNKFISTLKK